MVFYQTFYMFMFGLDVTTACSKVEKTIRGISINSSINLKVKKFITNSTIIVHFIAS